MSSENIERTLGRMEAKLDMLLELEPRTRALEKWKDETSGRIWGAAALGSVVITSLLGVFKFIWDAWKT